MKLTNESAIEAGMMLENTTVNFNNSMTVAEIQALIDAVPKNLGSYTLTFQFAAGAYTIDTQINFRYFYNGLLFIFGDPSVGDVLSTSQTTILNHSSSRGISIEYCKAPSSIRYVRLVSSATAWGACVYINACDMVSVWYCSVQTMPTYHNILVGASRSAYVNKCYASNGEYGLYVYNGSGKIQTTGNASTGTIPLVGMNALSGSTIAKDSTQFTGSSSNELSSSGGVIR